MRKVLTAALLCGAAFCATPAAARNDICINTRDIVNQTVENQGASIMFQMRDGTQWRNTLKSPCPGLVFNGLAWTVRNPDNSVCANAQSFRVLQSGEVCALGDFVKVPLREKSDHPNPQPEPAPVSH